MQVTYNFSRRDLRAYYEFSYTHDRVALNQLEDARRSERQSIAAMLLFVLVLGYETYRISVHSHLFPVFTAGAAVALLYGVVITIRRSSIRSNNRLVDYAVRHAESEALYGPVTIALTPEGVTHSSAAGTLFRRWSTGIDSIAETTDHVFVVCHPSGALMAPRAAFASPADASAFARAARDFLAEAGGPEHARDLLRYLAINDEPCPACGYNLRDIAQPRCPECGRQIVGRDIPNFVKFGPPALPPRGGAALTNLD